MLLWQGQIFFTNALINVIDSLKIYQYKECISINVDHSF